MIAESLSIPKTSSWDSERGFGKEKVVYTVCPSPPDTIVLVQEAYGNEAVKRLKVVRWYYRF
jgi:hypothetical protein